MKSRTTAFPIAVLALWAAPATAQLCYGGPGLASSVPAVVTGSVSFFDGGRTYGAGGSFGSDLFGSVGFSFTDFDDTDISLKALSGAIGYQVSPQESSITLCPALGLAYGFGLEILGIDVTTWSVTPSLAIAATAEVSPTVSLVPYAQIGLVYQRATADGGVAGEVTESDTSGVISLGAGLMFNEKVSLGPAVFVPLTDGGDTTFGVFLSLAVGNGAG